MRDKHIGFLIMNMEKGGGTERVTSLIANSMIEQGFKVSIISCQNGNKNCYELNKKVKLYSLRGENNSNALIRKVLCFQKLRKIVVEERIDVMVAVDISLYIYLFPLQITKSCKCIAWEHFNYYFKPSILTQVARRLAAKMADCIVVLGKKDLENYKEHLSGIRRIEYIYNPLPFSTQQKASMKEKRIIAVGRLTEQKGFDLLIDIWSQLENKYLDWSVDIFGEGPLREELEQKIHKLSLQRINLRGYSSDIKKEMLNSSVFVFSSRYEGFGLVLIEAQAVGLPCISFDCKEGPSEIIEDGVNGFLIEEKNIEMFVQKLEMLIASETLRNKFSSKTDINLNKYSIDSIIEKWIILLSDLLEGEK